MHQYTESGLNNIWLRNGYQDNDGNLSLEARNNLHYVIACELIDQKAKLSPNEFMFLRTELEATQALIANALGICESTVRNWEHGRSEISPVADRLIRLMYRSCAGDKTNLINLVNDLMNDDKKKQRIILNYATSWKAY